MNRVRIVQLWDRLRSSFWFVPALMSGAAVVLAFASVALDRGIVGHRLPKLDWVYTGGAEGASALLAAIAGSMITLAGLVFSLTLVALSLASAQFGPRLLRNFMRDAPNQLVLGMFVATFLYCLLVLRTIERGDEGVFVPHLSVTLSVVFAITSLCVLIYFIHHVAVSIQADELVAVVAADLQRSIDRLYPEGAGKGAPRQAVAHELRLPASFEHEARPLAATSDGYVQLIDVEELIALAKANDLILRIERRPGHYVVAGGPLLLAFPGTRPSDELVRKINDTFALGNQRVSPQDIEHAVNQLVEIAVRTLSAGINDPFTAIVCVDRLGSALARLAGRELPSPFRCDDSDALRVVAPAVTFADIADAAFNQIRQCARQSAPVTIRLLETLARLAPFVQRDEDRKALRRHADMISRNGEGLPEMEDQRVVAERYEEASRLLADRSG